MKSGIINIYKEKGYTSFDVCNKLRGILKTRKIGHTGTLDPDATGVLIVCVLKATKTVSLITDKDKVYDVKMDLSISTDTYDTSGNILKTFDKEEINKITDDEIKKCISSFIPGYYQSPPIYSAIKKDGKKLYELARSGVKKEDIEIDKRYVKIYDINSFKREGSILSFSVHCGKGTYIRSLCNDIGEKLSLGGTVTFLERTAVGKYNIKSSLRLSEIENKVKDNDLSFMMGIDSVFSDLKEFYFEKSDEKTVLNGGRIKFNNTGRYKCYLKNGDFVGIFEGDGKMLIPRKIFYEGS